MGDEFVEGGFSDEFLEVVEEMEALGELERVHNGGVRAYLLVRDATEGIIGVFALEINDKLGELMVLSEQVHRVL